MERKMEMGDYKKTIFDADAYIKTARNINIKRVLSKEKVRNFKGFISLWQLAELLSGGNKHTLQIVDQHCFDKELQQWRFLADPVSMVYHILYGGDPPYIERIRGDMTGLFRKALKGSLTERDKTYIKSQLEKVGENFVRGCKSFAGSIQNTDIATQGIRQIIKMAKDERGDKIPIKNEEIELIKKTFPGAGEYFEFLMRSKLPNSRNLNEEHLLHDQRDWQLFFYAGRDDVYVVTQESKIRSLGLKNVISLEEYLSNELLLSRYLRMREIISKICVWRRIVPNAKRFLKRISHLIVPQK